MNQKLAFLSFKIYICLLQATRTKNEMEYPVYKVMDCLPKDMLRALMRRERDRFSYQTIARMMKCRLGTVKSRIYRARKAILQSTASYR